MDRDYDDIRERQDWYQNFLAIADASYRTTEYPRYACPICKKSSRDTSAWVRITAEGSLSAGCHRCHTGITAIAAAYGLTPPWLDKTDKIVSYTPKQHRKPAPPKKPHKPAYPPETLWPKTEPIAGTPAEPYLLSRIGEIPSHLPLQSIRWLPAKAHNLAGLPSSSAGVICYTYWRTDMTAPQAIELDALTATGERPSQRWRRHAGSLTGAAFTAKPKADAKPPYLLLIAEGPMSALAVSTWCSDYDICLAAGPANNLPKIAELVKSRNLTEADAIIVSDGDYAGLSNSRKLKHRLWDIGIWAAIEKSERGKDPADRKEETDAE